MIELLKKNLEKDCALTEVPFVQLFTVEITTGSITKQVAQPGWKWSTHIKPLVGTDLCEVAHFGFVAEDSLTILQDGVEMVYGAGDVFEMPSGHDGWDNGNQIAVVYEIAQTNVLSHKK